MRGPYPLSVRLFLAALLLLPCISKLDQMNDGIWTLRDLGVPYPWAVAPGIVLLELVFGVVIAIGLQLRIALPALVFFTLLNGTIFRDLLLRDESLLQVKAAMASWLASSADSFRIVDRIMP